MAQKMDKGKLLKIGMEAFTMLEEYEAKKKGKSAAAAAGGGAGGSRLQQRPPVSKQPAAGCQYQYRPPAPLVYQVNPNTDDAKAMSMNSYEAMPMNSYEAMKMHDGVLIMDYSKKKSTATAY